MYSYLKQSCIGVQFLPYLWSMFRTGAQDILPGPTVVLFSIFILEIHPMTSIIEQVKSSKLKRNIQRRHLPSLMDIWSRWYINGSIFPLLSFSSFLIDPSMVLFTVYYCSVAWNKPFVLQSTYVGDGENDGSRFTIGHWIFLSFVISLWTKVRREIANTIPSYTPMAMPLLVKNHSKVMMSTSHVTFASQ